MNSNSLYLHTYLGVYSLNNNNNINNFLESPLLLCLFLSSRLIHWSLILTQGRRVKLATTERKTHWGDMDTGSCNALDFTSHDSYMLNRYFHAASRSCWNISRTPVQPPSSGAWVTYVLYKGKKYVNANIRLVYVELAQTHSNYGPYGMYEIRNSDKTCISSSCIVHYTL